MKEIVKECGDEAELLTSVDSPYVIRLHETNTINNKQYLIMEYANNGTLNTLIKKKKKENPSFGVEEIIS
jgi:serine/threonine protein kinase